MSHQQYVEWKPGVDSAVVNVCCRIITEPLLYFSEADIQQLLVEELHRVPPLSKTYPTSVRKGKDSKGRYQTSLVHREYGGGGGTRIDVVLFDPDDVAEIDHVNLTIGKEYLSPAYAFELGTEKTLNASAHLSSDVDKLRRRIKGTGYIIHFYKDVTQARTGTRSREKTEDRIDKLFKQVFMARRTQRIPKIKILAILLRTYRNQPKMCGKCEIFDGEKWRKVNISSNTALQHMIRRQLA